MICTVMALMLNLASTPSGRLTLVTSLLVSIACAVPSHARENDPPSDESLAEVYVFYSEPPFAYESGEEIEIRVRTTWDREKIEQAIRREVARAGSDVVVLTRSYSDWVRPPTLQRNRLPGPGPGPDITLTVPVRSQFVVGRIGKRQNTVAAPDAQRHFALEWTAAWDAVVAAVMKMGWHFAMADTDSRYLVTEPFMAAAPLVRCEEQTAGPLLAVFTIYVNTYRETTLVRVDTTFLQAGTRTPVPCRSIGVYEREFLRRVEELAPVPTEAP
jgi:hypothetical protein